MKLSPFAKFKKSLFDALLLQGFRPDSSGHSCEVYFCGFATVQCSVDEYDKKIIIERYYDSELIDMDRYINREIQWTDSAFPEITSIVILCQYLLESIRQDEPILNFDC